MRNLSNKSRSISTSETPGEAGSFTESTFEQDPYEDLVEQANTVPLTKIFRYYNLRCHQENKKIRCPFKTHKDGRENSASFNYYHDTNSWHCFGCHRGGEYAHGPHFVAAMEGISVSQAAAKILDLFRDDVSYNADDFQPEIDQDEQFEIMLGFSEMVREFRHYYPGDEAEKYINKACKRFDSINAKRDLNNKAIMSLIEELKQYIMLYKEQ
jgi:DNA primase